MSDTPSRLTAVVTRYNGRELLDVLLRSLAARRYRSDAGPDAERRWLPSDYAWGRFASPTLP